VFSDQLLRFIVRLTRALAPQMCKRRSGLGSVNVTSLAG